MSAVVDETNPLPVLREDLQLLKGPVAHNGTPSWNIYDPVCNKYFRIGWTAFQLISRWGVGSVNTLIDRVRNETTARVEVKDVERLIEFLHRHNLTRNSTSGSSADYLAQYQATQLTWYSWLIKNYLFIRIPIFRPSRFLRRTQHWVAPVYTRNFNFAMAALCLIGLYLVARQWDAFLSTFSYFFNLQGAAFYLCALVFIKIVHELGHAYTATRYGSRVASMGIAMLVMMPLLYTDTTDAWRLNSRRQRLLISAGGMIAELYLAIVFTFLWSFLPDGLLRSAAFIIATTSWIMSVLINLNILMRFDGYYILSDLLGVENLQDRAFLLGKWRLRQLLFDIRRPAPGDFSPLVRKKLIIYAWSVWIYRFFLFFGIALLVYHFFFKVLGILLFVVEIVWFIVNPIVKEFAVWNEMKDEIRQSNRYRLTTLICFILLSLFFLPWNTRIEVPAILRASNMTAIHSVSPGMVAEVFVNEGDEVSAGQPILVLGSPSLEDEITKTERQYAVTKLRSQRRASNIDDLANMQVVLEQLQELQSRLNGLYEQKDELTVRAPIDGKIVDLQNDLHPGRWINEKLRLAHVVGLDQLMLQGVIEGKELSQVGVDQDAIFIPDEPELDTIKARVIEIDNANMQVLDILYFASIYGGEVAVRKDKDKRLVPENSIYRIRFMPLHIDEYIPRVVRGEIHIDGKPRSFAFRTYDLIASVLIRESGF